MSLATYRSKRNFSATREPKGKRTAAAEVTRRKPMAKRPSASSGRRLLPKVLFVIQKHAATRLHYDFRLELEGVLKSWAVPKGMPLLKGEKHLAVEVEDHPVEYANFEGIIPAGNYGAGTVMLWDAGLAEIADPRAALRQGKLDLTLHGQKLNGQWTLVRMQPKSAEEKTPWLLIKTESDMRPVSAREDDRSVQSGRSMKQIALAAEKTWQSNRTKPNSRAKAPSGVHLRKTPALSRARR